MKGTEMFDITAKKVDALFEDAREADGTEATVFYSNRAISLALLAIVRQLDEILEKLKERT
jgi:hypothetical protein